MPQPKSGKRRILIVDDNRDAADTMAVMLETMGHETRTVYDGRGGLKLAADYRPDVVLLDIGLPEINGYEVARQIREQPWGKEIVLIALTGWGKEEDKRRAADAGFDYHLTKPADVGRLETLIAQDAGRRNKSWLSEPALNSLCVGVNRRDTNNTEIRPRRGQSD